ncbi:hypothetical protein FRC12_011621 [Ceratobasidium sp. 428]|nr:hypothetical protein FRC12_011621 [Ceratobasidium sp. 428]
MLVDRINNEDVTNGPRLTACACELLVSLDLIEATYLDDENTEYSTVGLHSIRDTELAMSKLKNLKRIYWGSAWSSTLPQTLREVQVHTKVQSIDLQVELFRLDQASAKKIFALEGLKKFYIKLSFTPTQTAQGNWEPWDEQEITDKGANRFKRLDLASLIFEMLRASPDLEELGFTFVAERDSTSLDDRRNPETIFTALADHNFPRLRVFRVSDLWEYRESPGLRRFLLNHPSLHTVDLYLNMSMELLFDTEDIETVFPSVRYFKGPYQICCALTHSRVAQQLETLSIYKTHDLRLFEFPAPLRPVRPSLLPRLRNLEVIYIPVPINDLVEMAPNIENLTMSGSLEVCIENTVSSKDFMKFLRQIPKLRVLNLSLGDSHHTKKRLTADHVRWFMRRVASICPQLFRIEYLGDFSYWDIAHNHDGDVSFHYHFDPSFDLFPGLELPRAAITSGLGFHPWNRHDEWYGSLGPVNGVV